MISTRSTLRRSVAGLTVTGLLLAAGPGALAGPAGAIFTTDSRGWYVNANVYESASDVYLNGGPRPNAPCDAAGLPDGDYHFQVRDPSGATPLSSDGIDNRTVTVAGGIIVGVGASSTHATGTGKCNSVTVQLCPFDKSPNEGDEYKVWMTRVEDYQAFGGFVPQASKTDNFKVTTNPCGGAD